MGRPESAMLRTVLLVAMTASYITMAHEVSRLDTPLATASMELLPEDEAALSLLEQKRDELMAFVEEMESAAAPVQPKPDTPAKHNAHDTKKDHPKHAQPKP